MINKYNNTVISVTIQSSQFKQRLDYALSILLPSYSRSQIKHWILSGKVSVNGTFIFFPKKKVLVGDNIRINNVIDKDNNISVQNIPLDIIYEDEDILIINKASNMVVHPGAGHTSGTILNGLLYRYPSITQVFRAGIVQRLDKDTTGLMVIAKHIESYNNLIQSFKKKEVIREYEAIVYGRIINNIGIINQPIRRHTIRRTCMTVHPMGKSAITHYSVLEILGICTRIRVYLETGRTHQIRVHMSYINHPVIGDKKYGKFYNFLYKKGISDQLKYYLFNFNRQALHACTLKLCHPITKKKMQWNVPLPEDIINLICVLKEYGECSE